MEIWRAYGLSMVLIYSFGASFIPFYRLVGSFRDAYSAQVARTEMAETIARCGILGNPFMGVMPMVTYAIVNAAVWLLPTIWYMVISPL